MIAEGRAREDRGPTSPSRCRSPGGLRPARRWRATGSSSRALFFSPTQACLREIGRDVISPFIAGSTTRALRHGADPEIRHSTTIRPLRRILAASIVTDAWRDAALRAPSRDLPAGSSALVYPLNRKGSAAFPKIGSDRADDL